MQRPPRALPLPCPALPESSLDHDLRRGATGSALELIAHLDGDVAIDFCMRPVWLGRDHRKPGIGLFADRHVQRHLAEEGYAQPLGFVARTAVAENVGARA